MLLTMEKELSNVAQNLDHAWIVIGDFNCIFHESEKNGGGKILLTKISTFRNCLLDCGLMDMGFCGHPYTWNNRRF